MLLSSLAAVLCLSFVLGEAPDMDMSTCITMDPYDATLPQLTPEPYELVSSKTGTITNQDSVILTIKCKQPRVEFQQFIVQARDVQSGVAVGIFVDTGDADIQMVNCFYRSENTAVEFDTENKREARMRWMPDYDYEGNVTFMATYIQRKDVFWLKKPGDTIHVYNPW